MEEKEQREPPSVFAVYQQQGPTCPYIPFCNLEKIRKIREREKCHIIFQESDYVSKIDSYALFLPIIRVLDCAYDSLRTANGPYANYETSLRSEGIKSNHQYNEKGKSVDKIDFFPTDQARRKSATPYNIKVETFGVTRWVPLFHTDEDQIYFYNYTTKKAEKLQHIIMESEAYNSLTDHCLYLYREKENKFDYKCYRFEEKTLDIMGISREEMKNYRIVPSKQFLGSKTGYFLYQSVEDIYSKETFYNVGTYQHILFACGINRENELFTEQSKEWDAYQDLHKELQKNDLNPWHNINKDDIFEYHLAHIFKNNNKLKEMVIQTINFYNNYWNFYKESFDFYDSPQLPKTKFSDKQKYLPGEDQMLAYFFSKELRFIWASTISLEALIATEELINEIGENTVKALKTFSWFPGVPSTEKILKAAQKKIGNFNNSFLDVWEEIKGALMIDVVNKSKKFDFVTFSGHGSVISFDTDLIKLQSHENRGIAEKLGFEMWESLYKKGIKPFYQKKGTKENVIQFN